MMELATKTSLTTERQAELVARWHECFSSYPFTKAGERHLQALVSERAAIRENYTAICAAAHRGADVTDSVLAQLLPYTNTAAHRARGVWVSHAAAIRGDLRLWLQARQPESRDWQALSAALLVFIRQALDKPQRLRVACEVFASNSATKGLQTGLLSPVLHALGPDAFCLINQATLQVINSFAQQRFSLQLREYPALNAAGLALLRVIAPHLGARDMLPGVELTDHLDVFARWLATVKRWPPAAPRAWRIALPDAPQWDAWTREGYICLPADAAGSPQEGERIIAHRGTVALAGIGEVAGPAYRGAQPDGERVPVRWLSLATIPIKKPGWRAPFAAVSQRALLTLPAMPAARACEDVADGQAHAATPQTLREADAAYSLYNNNIPIAIDYTLQDCASETGIDEERLANWRAALERKGQVVFYGPPGTGKTFLAEKLARVVSGADGVVELVQFHPGYAYEDFIQGIRPRNDASGAVQYPLEPGRLLEFCARARGHPGKCVLIVDEMNRANLAQVLGEALHALEYRDQPIALAAGGALTIPANVRVIGTMNTADRSIAHVDHAVRRRFAWLHLPPDYAILRRFHAPSGYDVAPLVALLERINQAIGDANLAIGISYFLRPDLAAHLEAIWQTEIEPFIQEALYDRPERSEVFRWAAVRKTLAVAPRRRSRG